MGFFSFLSFFIFFFSRKTINLKQIKLASLLFAKQAVGNVQTGFHPGAVPPLPSLLPCSSLGRAPSSSCPCPAAPAPPQPYNTT